MNTRILRTLVSLAVVAAAYVVYAVAAVPMIEPRVELPAAPPEPVPPHTSPRERGPVDPDFAAWFEPDSWELNDPMVFRTPTGILLLQDYQQQEDGTFKITPCTMVLVANDEDDAVRRRRAVILRADEGATLRFDGVDLGRASTGRLVGGTIHGEVRIHSEQQSPGPEDDLFMSTRDVQVSEDQIWTHNRVWFHYGPHNGSARGMRVELASVVDDGDNKKKIAGAKTIELTREVKMKLFLPRNRGEAPGESPQAGGVFGMFSGHATTSADRQPGSTTAHGGRPDVARARQQNQTPDVRDGIPVDVECAGPFVFDVDALSATFNDDVEVVGRADEEHNDTLSCQQLSLFFVRDETKTAPKAPTAGDNSAAPPDEAQSADANAAPASDDNGFSNLRPSRLEARGAPVTFVSPSSGVIATGKYLEYDLDASAGVLKGEPAAELKQQGASTIQAPELRFVTDAHGELVRFAANGAGFMQREAVDDHDALVARWQTLASYEPELGENRLSLIGNAEVNVSPNSHGASATPRGSIASDELYVWFLKTTDDAKASNRRGQGEQPQRGAIPAIGGNNDPSRLLAEGDVRIHFDGLQGEIDRAEMWFEQTTVPGAAAPGAAANTPVPSIRRPGPYAQGPQPRDPYRRTDRAPSEKQNLKVTGGKLQVEFATGGDRPMPTAVRVFGSEMDAPPQPGGGIGSIVGTPANVSGRGMAVLSSDTFTLAGPLVEMTPPSSRGLIDGAGTLSYRVDQGLDGQKTGTPDWVEVQWRDRVAFEGRVAHVLGDVEAKMAGGHLRCQEMDLVFDRAVDLASFDGSNRKPELNQIVCKGGVELNQIQNDDAGRLVAVQRIRAVNLTLEQVSGDFRADGPGEAVVIRTSLGGEDGLIAGDAFGARPITPPRPTPAAGAEQLSYIGLEFQYGVSGNLPRRASTFMGKVVTIYGPVKAWDAHVDPDDFEQLGSSGVRMECDRLELVRMEAPNRQPWVEMVASGQTRVEGEAFTGLAAQIRYDQSKDVLTLEGDGRSDAKLYLQQSVGGQPTYAAARKLQYSRSTGRYSVDGFYTLDINQIPQPPQAQARKQTSNPQPTYPQQRPLQQGYAPQGYPAPGYVAPGFSPQPQLAAPLRRSAGVPVPNAPQ